MEQTAESVVEEEFPGLSNEAPPMILHTARKSPVLSQSAAHKPGFLNRHLKVKHPALLSPHRQRRFSKGDTRKLRKNSIFLQDHEDV